MSDFAPENGRPDLFHNTDDALRDSITLAVRENDKSTLLQLLKNCQRNPLSTYQQDWMVLHEAARSSELKDCLELLLEYKDSSHVDIDAQLADGKTALHVACENDCQENVEILLRNGCDAYKKTLENFTALHVAAAKGNVQIVKHLLNYPKNINEPSDFGLTPLHSAVRHDHLEVCRILLEKGADIRSKDTIHRLPLHCVRRWNSNIARLLLKSDPTTINCPNVVGKTPLIYAVVSGLTETNCDLEDVRFLLENGAKVEICDVHGRTALYYAVLRGNAEVLLLLLQYTDASRLENCLSNIQSVLNENLEIYSLTCTAIESGKLKYLEILLSSNLSKSILEIPQVEQNVNSNYIYSPLACLFETITPGHKLFDSFLQLMLKHKITMLDEFSKRFPIKWPQEPLFVHPFNSIIGYTKVDSRGERYLDRLHSNGVNIDYCLRCYQNSSQPFATFTDYKPYYYPLGRVIFYKDIKILKLFMSTSAILEPDIVCFQFHPILSIPASSSSSMILRLEEYREMIQYLISLKPVYFIKFQLCGRDDLADWPRFPYSTVGEEFSYSTLQQLCRTVIRHHVREPTLEKNLHNFRKNILDLPLPSSLKDYLLFKE